jgi:hypothetical protein
VPTVRGLDTHETLQARARDRAAGR